MESEGLQGHSATDTTTSIARELKICLHKCSPLDGQKCILAIKINALNAIPKWECSEHPTLFPISR